MTFWTILIYTNQNAFIMIWTYLIYTCLCNADWGLWLDRPFGHHKLVASDFSLVCLQVTKLFYNHEFIPYIFFNSRVPAYYSSYYNFGSIHKHSYTKYFRYIYVLYMSIHLIIWNIIVMMKWVSNNLLDFFFLFFPLHFNVIMNDMF